MRFSLMRFTNLAILVDTFVLGISGVYSLFWNLGGWVLDVHRIAGWCLIALIPWKVTISWRSLRRGLQANLDRGVMVVLALLLALLTLAVIALGIVWHWGVDLQPGWLGQTLIAWHWILGLALILPLVVHVWRRWPHPKQVDLFSRRAFLKTLLVGAVGLAGWEVSNAVSAFRARELPAHRFTGSRQAGSYTQNSFPVTNNPGEDQIPIDTAAWRLVVEQLDGSQRRYSYADLLSLPAKELMATIDCTLGWYSAHRWKGVPLSAILNASGDSSQILMGVQFESVAGYSRALPMNEARQVLLATHVDGQILYPWHGFPLRAVVPSRRGWFWVKWLSRIKIVYL